MEDQETAPQNIPTQPKRIVLCTSGSRGDVQPFLAIGLALKERGHHVRICTEERMRGLVEESGLEFYKISGDPTGVLFEKQAQVMLRNNEIMSIMKKTAELKKTWEDQAFRDYLAGCEGFDIIVSHPLCLSEAYCAAENMKVPFVTVCLGPVYPTGDFPIWAVTTGNLYFSWLNRATYSALYFALWMQDGSRINAMRSKLGLPAITYKTGLISCLEVKKIPVIVACSEFYIPTQKRPADWPQNIYLTGFLFIPPTPSHQVDSRLQEFFEGCSVEDRQEKPIYLGFGSMPAPEPQKLLQFAIKLVTHLQKRAVFCGGWTELDSLLSEESPNKIEIPPQLLIIKAAPHDWLFPRCSCIVHHCGINTCATVLQAGVPSVPCPVMLDQPFNASRLHKLGVATEPLPFHQITLDALASRIKTASTCPAMHERARQIATQIQGENGVGNVSDVILTSPSPW